MKSRNIAFKNSAESGTNISPEPKQKEISNEFDPYTDASLSGTLEWIYVDENIISIAAKGISHEIEYQDDSLDDHNYSNPSCSSASKSVMEPPLTQLTQLTNDPDEYPEVGCNHLYTELSQDTDNYSAHDDVDNIETEIVSMKCTETYITSAQGSSGYFHQAPGSIPGTNTPTNTMQNIQYTMDATVATLKEISISNSSDVVSGTNIASRQYNMMGINMNAVIGADNTEPVDSDLQMSDNWQTDTIQGINNTNSSSGESSDFEGFTSADLKSFTTPSTYLTDGSSTILSPDDYSYDNAVEDSSDTIPATDPTDDTDNTRQKLNYLTSMNNNTNSILPDIINLWEKDVMNKKLTVPLCKLTPMDIYALSKLPPNWDTMNPYSSLDEVQGSANETQTKPLASTKSNMKQDQARNKSPRHRKLQRSSRTGKWVAYLEESTSNENDSDYEPPPKPVRNINVGLKAPSSTRIHTQNIIRLAKENSEAGKRLLLLNTADDGWDRKCPYCNNTFFFSEGVRTHIQHAHHDIVDLKGINDRSNDAETARNSVKGKNGSNKSGNVMGVNNHRENSKTNENDVKGTNDQELNVNVPTLNNTASNQKNASLPSSGDKPAVNTNIARSQKVHISDPYAHSHQPLPVPPQKRS